MYRFRHRDAVLERLENQGRKETVPLASYTDLLDEIALKGRRGTDFCPGFVWLEEQGSRPGVCLYPTDMASDSYPENEPDFPVIWCGWGPPTTDWNREPWGERIDIPSK